ncbi:phosphodiesterase [Treponema sp.]|uniref:phosphodiesterase n=1 Tax=Treponema sp. TaxID=166 RepID=UPI0025D6FA76|nr:phosphodiesterase [Treponema sp.]MCR5218447.1 phosphodiesterase [Treponema sp.]
MKLFIASDIHGSAFWCQKMLERFEEEQAQKILLLGDILYHGPRNDLPDEYAPKKVIEMLNPLAERIICVRGNCDAEVDQMVLKFPVLADYALLERDGLSIFATHGHLFGQKNPPLFVSNGILLCGHTHVPACCECQTEDGKSFWYLNTGSVSIPKENSCHSYIVLEDGLFKWKNVEDGKVYMEKSFVK